MAFMNFVHAFMSFPHAVAVQVSTHQAPFRDSRYIISETFVQSKDEGQISGLVCPEGSVKRAVIRNKPSGSGCERVWERVISRTW